MARLPINDAAEHAAVQNVWRESSRRKITDSVYQVQKENCFYSSELTF